MITTQAALDQAALLLPPELKSETELLLAHVLGKDKSFILAHPEFELDQKQYEQFIVLTKRRSQGEPMAYLSGYQDFYGRRFMVTPDVLIPRADSETIITEALKFLGNEKTASILDIGTGSGCLIITLAAETNNRFQYYGSDVSSKALMIAKENAVANQTNTIQWFQSNLLGSIPPQPFDLIIANLPYLTAEQLQEPTIQSEPTLALDGGKDGLHFYRQLLKKLPDYLNESGIALLEIDPGQKNLLEAEIKKQLPDRQLEFVKDLSGRIRACLITKLTK